MSLNVPSGETIAVIKLGGSVLTDPAAYARAAKFLQRRARAAARRRIVAVVSAQLGQTDELLAEARGIAPDPDAATVDLLWSTGELRSVALLTLHLRALGASATGLNPHQTGIFVPDDGATSAPLIERVEVNPLGLRFALAHATIVVVPGFLARGPRDTLLSLGRGGSDLTAVLLAEALGAATCELIKDVPGYFDKDPNVFVDAQPISALTFDDALSLADAGCDLVQREALLVAQRAGTTLVVCGLQRSGTKVERSPSAACLMDSGKRPRATAPHCFSTPLNAIVTACQ